MSASPTPFTVRLIHKEGNLAKQRSEKSTLQPCGCATRVDGIDPNEVQIHNQVGNVGDALDDLDRRRSADGVLDGSVES